MIHIIQYFDYKPIRWRLL